MGQTLARDTRWAMVQSSPSLTVVLGSSLAAPSPTKSKKDPIKDLFFPKGCQVELGQETADRDGQTHSAQAAAATPGKNSAKESETHVHIHARTVAARGRNPIRYFIPRLSLIWLSELKEHPCVPVNPRLRQG